MTRKQAEKIDRRCRRIIAILAVVLVTHMIITTVRGNIRQQEEAEKYQESKTVREQQEDIEYILQETERIHESGGKTESDVIQEESGVFDGMSQDYGGEDEGFVYYQIPADFAMYGGYFPEEVQKYTYCLCKQEGVRYALIVAMIERESGYRYDCIGDDGESMGYMQIMQKWHTEKMEEIGCDDLLNPYQNIRIGVEYMAKLIEKYGTIQDALAAYNHGEAGAYEHLWSNGIYVYDYNEEIMNRMKEIEEELEQ